MTGKGQIDSFLLDLESALTNPASIATRKAEFVTWYRSAYCEAWHAFGLNFGRGMERLNGSQEWRTLCAKAASPNGLYFLVLKRMADELKPFSSETMPDWMKFVYEFEKMQTVATQLQTGAMAKAAETATKLKEKIQEKIGKEKAVDAVAQGYNAARALSEYQNALGKIAASVGKSRAAAFQGASVAFGDDPAASPFMAAQSAARRLNAESAMPSEGLWRLAYGPFDFLFAYACQESACHLQALWEKEVLVDIQGISDPGPAEPDPLQPRGSGHQVHQGPGRTLCGQGSEAGLLPQRGLRQDPALRTGIPGLLLQGKGGSGGHGHGCRSIG